MRITFLHSGGLAGAIRGLRLDPALLPAAEREELERLVAGCGLAGSCERSTAGGRDRRRYDLAIDRDGRIDRLSCDDGCVPDAARPLVAYLAERATPQGPEFTLPAATEAEVAAVARYFQRHDVAAEDSPTLEIDPQDR